MNPPLDELSRTHQSFKDECDINNIVRRNEKNGTLGNLLAEGEQINKNRYGDFSSPVDYQEAMNLVVDANERFDALPARVRKRFNNDPKEFLEFTADPQKNIHEMVSLGLATPQLSDQHRAQTLAQNASPKTQTKKAKSGSQENEGDA